MNWNSARLMPWLRSAYCGLALYLANSESQAASFSGGMAPVTGRHSVIERPEPVKRVAPPTITIASTRMATMKSHVAVGRERSSFRNEVICPPTDMGNKAQLGPRGCGE